MKLSDFDFRVWDGRKYVNNIKGGVYIHKKDTDVKCLNRNQDCYDYEFELDDLDNYNLEIELFTGFYDKKGTKIYEGDILEYKDLEELYHVTRDNTYKMFKIEIFSKNFNNKIYKRKAEPDISFLKSFKSDANMEVIGNIHEDFNLLKELK